MIRLSNHPHHVSGADSQTRQWVYNAIDACVTAEVGDALLAQLKPNQSAVYTFERACRGPALAMQTAGLRVDDAERRKVLKERIAEGAALQKAVSAMAVAAGAEPIKYLKGLPPSTQQVQKVLFGAMKLPVQRNFAGNPTADKETLNKLAKRYANAKPFIDTVLRLREWQKQIEVLRDECLSPDGRFRAAFSVGQTETGRWSSTGDCYGDGDNLQNKDRRIRRIFLADVGKRMIHIDLAQAESRCIAYLAGDEAYIQAHEEGNVHVRAGWIFWPDSLPWTHDLQKDKKLMKQIAVPWIKQEPPKPGELPAFNYYDMSKRGQHGLNYGLTEVGLATWLGVKQAEALRLLRAYFSAYPRIPDYHKFVSERLKTIGTLVSPLGRERQFFGRPWEKATVREGLANTPQGMTVDVMNIALLRIWDELVPERVTLHLQGHDAILMQARDDDAVLPALKARILELARVEMPVRGIDGVLRTMIIPVEMEEGYNWRDLK